MRYLAAVLSLLLATACFKPVPPTAPDSAAPKGAQTIVAMAPGDSAEALYRRAAAVLQDSGYAIASSDAELRQITTTVRKVAGQSFGGADYTVQLQATIRSSPPRVHFSGHYETGSLGEQRIERTGKQGTVPREAWMRMYRVATAVSDSLMYRGGS